MPETNEITATDLEDAFNVFEVPEKQIRNSPIDLRAVQEAVSLAKMDKDMAVVQVGPTKIPQDLIDYLVTLISPPAPSEPAVFLGELSEVDWEAMRKAPDNSVTGFVVRGTPTPEQSKEFNRVLMPGAHILLIAPDAQPTGHTGTCNIEDAGFDIRDSILWIREEDDGFYYVPKASRAEREAGCENLPVKVNPLTDAEKLEIETLTAKQDKDETEIGRLAELTQQGEESGTIRNHHPTVKPVELMVRLLGNIPIRKGFPIVDPFMGSGTTGLACIETGHDFIGIDLEPEYVQIAYARAMHKAREFKKGDDFGNFKITADATLPPDPLLSKTFGIEDDDAGKTGVYKRKDKKVKAAKETVEQEIKTVSENFDPFDSEEI